jgi:hypothetical protein
MGAPQNLFIYFNGSILIGPSAIVLDHWGMPPIEGTSLDPQLQNRNKCAPLDYSLFIGEFELWANHMS